MNKPPVSIEVVDGKGHATIKAGQYLTMIRETPCFLWVRGHDGVAYQVSKKTKRINGTTGTFLRTSKQPLLNF